MYVMCSCRRQRNTLTFVLYVEVEFIFAAHRSVSLFCNLGNRSTSCLLLKPSYKVWARCATCSIGFPMAMLRYIQGTAEEMAEK